MLGWLALALIHQHTSIANESKGQNVSGSMTHSGDIILASGVADDWSTVCPCEWEYTA